MTIPAADGPYLAVVSDAAAATTPDSQGAVLVGVEPEQRLRRDRPPQANLGRHLRTLRCGRRLDRPHTRDRHRCRWPSGAVLQPRRGGFERWTFTPYDLQ